MKKITLLILALFATMQFGISQKYAYVDSEYILSNIPAYRSAQDQLDEMAEEWENEIDQMYGQIEEMYRNFQSERVLMSDEMRKKREEEIMNLEAEAKKLQHKYFGPEGEMYQKQEELIGPIQDQVYNAIEEIAEEGDYAVIFDMADSATLLYTNPQYDLSDEVLGKLGY